MHTGKVKDISIGLEHGKRLITASQSQLKIFEKTLLAKQKVAKLRLNLVNFLKLYPKE